ncbi:ATP-dependent DNA helicase 2 subunit 1 [Acrasis kona]|uniref:ATP-dependent DNA helicase 2 subunit 1 n=1 Tax=Acrasis kona TaxID=1008807 RepID=A0AAW2ZBB9_9EUKA
MSQTWQEWNDDPLSDVLNDEDESEEADEARHDKDSILFMIDAGETMFEKTLEDIKTEDERDVKPFYYAVKCASQAYCDKIISSTSDVMGKEKKNPYDFDNVYLYHDMDIPDANRIKQLEGISDASVFGHAPTKNSLDNALWTCQHLFNHVPKNVGYKRIFLFTNDEDPTSSAEMKKKCLERSRYLIESDITIELFVLKSKTAPFDANIFWNKLIAVGEDEYTGNIVFDYADRLEVLRDKVRRKEHKKRSMCSLPLEISDNLSLSVSLFNMIHRTKRSNPTYLHADTNRQIKSQVRNLCIDTGSELMPKDIIYAYDYGGKRVQFTKQELIKIKEQITDKQQSIKLLGFKPSSRLKFSLNIRPSSFLYPNSNITGSLQAFAALHTKMIEMDRIAIVRMLPRANASPIYAALTPSKEKLDEDGAQISPPGFHVIYLPFADGVRKLSVQAPEGSVKVGDDAVNAAKRICKKINFLFDPLDFDNPALQKHYAALQALALERSNIEPVKDHVMPDVEGMKKYKEEIEKFKATVYPHDYHPESDEKKKPAPKRKKEDDEQEEKPKKKAKTVKKEDEDDQEGDEDEGIDMVALAKDDNLNSLTLPVLKEFLKQYKLAVSGTKPVIVKRIVDFLKEKGKI